MYKTILVPLDGSTRAEAILGHVEEIAQAEASKVILLHVVDPASSLTGLEGVPYDVNRELIEEESAEAQRYLEAKAGELRAKHIDTCVRLRYGEIVKSIAEAAEAEEADLIAIASHGRTGLSRLFYGSVAAGVLQRVDRPLLLIRAQHDN
ncbi:MAG: universal stress protein [Anaerolineae bacterium]|nr:universal stress protein [Anaerolineae bacterium]